MLERLLLRAVNIIIIIIIIIILWPAGINPVGTKTLEKRWK